MFAEARGARRGVARYIVVITDGRSDDRQQTWQEAIAARRDGIWIVSVGVGGGINAKELMAMASAPLEHNVLRADTFKALDAAFATRISHTICRSE